MTKNKQNNWEEIAQEIDKCEEMLQFLAKSMKELEQRLNTLLRGLNSNNNN